MRHLCKWTTLAEHQWTSNVRQLTVFPTRVGVDRASSGAGIC